MVPLKIDGDKQEKLASKFGVEGWPTIVFLDPNGKVIGRFLGFHPAPEFVQLSKDVLKSRKGK